MTKSNVCTIKEPMATEILPNLFLGNVKAAESESFLDKHKIRCIIRILEYENIPREVKISYQKIDDIHHFSIPIRDMDTCLINLNKIFDKTSLIIKTFLRSNKAVLVHCKRGHHRSATVVAAFMIKHLKTDYISTVKYINSKRGCALRRDTCMVRWLFRYYRYILKNECENIQPIRDNGVFNFKCIDESSFFSH